MAEDTHWTPFIEASIKYIRETYPRPWSEVGITPLDLQSCVIVLKQRCHHFDEIFVTGCPGTSRFDNSHCNSQWWKIRKNSSISVSAQCLQVIQITMITVWYVNKRILPSGHCHKYSLNVRSPETDSWHPYKHDDVIKWKHFPRYWPFVRGIHRSRWIPSTKASDAELWCFLWSAPE